MTGARMSGRRLIKINAVIAANEIIHTFNQGALP
jgi:hypothetical protein